MSIQQELQTFYDAHAEKYYHTRNKHRSDADVFLDQLVASNKKSLRILEFGCGSGRLLAQLAQLKGITITYIWVDLSKNLLAFAKKQLTGKWAPKHIKATFVCDDILHYITTLPQESFDFVIGIASFQHIPNDAQRFLLIKNIYRILHYEGKLMMTNWSFSDRFLKKYRTQVVQALWRFLVSFGKYQWNDIMIPRKNGTTIAYRFYHIYTLAQLQKFIIQSWFVIDKLTYLPNKGPVASWRSSKNSLLIATKHIFLG